MLDIWYCGGNIEVLTDAPRYFDNVWEDEWLEDPLVKQMIKDVDNSEVISPHLIESPVLGPIGPRYLRRSKSLNTIIKRHLIHLQHFKLWR